MLKQGCAALRPASRAGRRPHVLVDRTRSAIAAARIITAAERPHPRADHAGPGSLSFTNATSTPSMKTSTITHGRTACIARSTSVEARRLLARPQWQQT